MPKRRFKTQFNKRPVVDGVFPCDEIREGDGEDPRLDREPRKVANRKALQLCSQIKDSLNIILGYCADEILMCLTVDSVIPAPDSSQLLVSVIAPDDIDKVEVMEHLGWAGGKIRTEIASSIHRKKVPQIRFEVK